MAGRMRVSLGGEVRGAAAGTQGQAVRAVREGSQWQTVEAEPQREPRCAYCGGGRGVAEQESGKKEQDETETGTVC